jgi:hypothetical protein
MTEEAMNRTNFDAYLEEHLQDPVFAERFELAQQAWEKALAKSDPESDQE